MSERVVRVGCLFTLLGLVANQFAAPSGDQSPVVAQEVPAAIVVPDSAQASSTGIDANLSFQDFRAGTTSVAQISQITTPPPQRPNRDPLPASPQLGPQSGGNALQQAAQLATIAEAQTRQAQTPQDWDQVARLWLQAIAALQSIPPTSPQRLFAQKELATYVQNLSIAQRRAMAVSFPIVHPSFNSPILDEQLALYLSYLSVAGTPDVLIVGSSRALQGIDPQMLRQALADRGLARVQVYNFGVNGATAQVVDFVLRQLLTPEQLPRVILWADGSRAFNEGRPDRTFEAIVQSAGYQSLLQGRRPRLTTQNNPEYCPPGPSSLKKSDLETADDPAQPLPSLSDSDAQFAIPQEWLESEAGPNSPRLAQPRIQPCYASGDDRVSLAPQPRAFTPITALGFEPVPQKFDPEIYFQRYPQVPGLYDGDYRAFRLDGAQAAARDRVITLARQQSIALVFVSLPLTADYLDQTRLTYETQFHQTMQAQALAGRLRFLNLTRQWPNQYRYFADPSHINREGAAAVAQAIARSPQLPWAKWLGNR